MARLLRGTVAALLLGVVALAAQSVREHTRPTPNRSTSVSEAQAGELTLTVTDVAVRPIQVWIRTAGVAARGPRTLTGSVPAAEAAFLRTGQRVRVFSPESRSSMYQGRVVTLSPPQDGRAAVEVALAGPGREGTSRYIMEIVAENDWRLSVPNEAIIEDNGRQIVYVQQSDGGYVPRQITAGLQGELFTEVLDGVQAGERVVTFGSFFVDVEHKLKGS